MSHTPPVPFANQPPYPRVEPSHDEAAAGGAASTEHGPSGTHAAGDGADGGTGGSKTPGSGRSSGLVGLLAVGVLGALTAGIIAMTRKSEAAASSKKTGSRSKE